MTRSRLIALRAGQQGSVLTLVSLIGLASMALAAPPTVNTSAATDVLAEQATLNRSVSPNGQETLAWFEWGTTTNYGSVTPTQLLSSNAPATNFSQVVTGLTASSTYHFRALASNSAGMAAGADQSFTTVIFRDVTAGITGVRGSAVWGDYDGDGRLDILIAGWSDTGLISEIWRNTGAGFTNTGVSLPGARSAGWFDFDNDGLLDILLDGTVWRNTGLGFANTFVTLVSNGVYSYAFGDYDNDGRTDVLLTGYSYSSQASVAQVWRNTGTGFATNNTILPGADAGAWGDYDNDGRLDILIGARGPGPSHATLVWWNTGSGFTNINAGLPPFKNGSVAWADYDNDGRLDIILAGELGFGPFEFQVWRNTGGGFVKSNPDQGSPWYAAAALGDYDNDGRIDVLLTSLQGMPPLLYRNTPGGFVRMESGLPEFYGKAAWGDYDHDGRLDLLIAGTTMGPQQPPMLCQVWRNRIAQTNSRPAPPFALTVTAAGNAALLSWNSGSDAETASAGLTYNLRVGTTPGGFDVVSPMSLGNGTRMIAHFGNRQEARTCLFNVPLNQTLYWSVQAVDSAFAGSAFAPEFSFRLNSSFISTNESFLGDLNRDGVVDTAEFSIVLSNYFRLNPPAIDSASQSTTNVFQFGLSNLMSLGFTVLATTNVELPLAEWENIGAAALLYQFTDPAATNHPARFYKLQWP